jgi:hypothetical protein
MTSMFKIRPLRDRWQILHRARLKELDAIYPWWEEPMPGLREEYLAHRLRARCAEQGRQ